jgi:hypothetical protein
MHARRRGTRLGGRLEAAVEVTVEQVVVVVAPPVERVKARVLISRARAARRALHASRRLRSAAGSRRLQATTPLRVTHPEAAGGVGRGAASAGALLRRRDATRARGSLRLRGKTAARGRRRRYNAAVTPRSRQRRDGPRCASETRARSRVCTPRASHLCRRECAAGSTRRARSGREGHKRVSLQTRQAPQTGDARTPQRARACAAAGAKVAALRHATSTRRAAVRGAMIDTARGQRGKGE